MHVLDTFITHLLFVNEFPEGVLVRAKTHRSSINK